MRTIALLISLMSICACGERPPRIGVLINEADLRKTRLGPAPDDLPSREFLPGSSLLRAKDADVLGDEASERLVELADQHGIEIRDRAGTLLGRITTPEYLTDFGAVKATGADKQDVVLYTYPNERRGGTFRVVTADQREVARWEESPPLSRFAVGLWAGAPALFYLQRNEVVVRSPTGLGLRRLPAPDGDRFSRVHVLAMASGQTVLVASGDGYTPYHMVCVYDADGRLLFQEIADEHAFDLERGSDERGFVVLTRSSRWEYRPL